MICLFSGHPSIKLIDKTSLKNPFFFAVVPLGPVFFFCVYRQHQHLLSYISFRLLEFKRFSFLSFFVAPRFILFARETAAAIFLVFIYLLQLCCCCCATSAEGKRQPNKPAKVPANRRTGSLNKFTYADTCFSAAQNCAFSLFKKKMK
jgi:hypothetical protein